MSTQVGTESPKVESVAPVVKPDTRLAELMEKNEKSAKAAGSSFAAIIDYIASKREQITNEVIMATLKKRYPKDEQQNTVKVEYSRIIKFLVKDETGALIHADKIEAFRKGDITVQAMRSVKTGSPAGRKKETPVEKLVKGIQNVADWSVYNCPEITKHELLEKVGAAFDYATERFAEEKAEAQRQAGGEFQGGQQAAA